MTASTARFFDIVPIAVVPNRRMQHNNLRLSLLFMYGPFDPSQSCWLFRCLYELAVGMSLEKFFLERSSSSDFSGEFLNMVKKTLASVES